ncbi:hypothetical protein [Nodosilinea sp. E11]|uniref:cupin domain-containing protein n=1 Tax=Nodosilinea sp. E11 TaxID=3037479 RepID=UPI0029347BCB|nr:hypothetical protein [Nodosilinea sp. E11]WOD39918.1 hypothetical protein RRF56_03830 [Nodosilinea sp. E11]
MNNLFSINSTYVVMDENGSAIPVPVNATFFEDLERQFGDFKGKQLISHYTFTQDWDTWEMHPAGDEFVCLLSGQVEFILEQDSGETKVQMSIPGEFVIVPQEVWHTAKVHAPSSVLFVTPGEGTQNRPL